MYSAQSSFSWPRVDLARLLRRAYSRPFWIISFEFVKVCRFVFLSGKASLVSISACCYPIATILACLFSVGVRIRGKSCVESEHGGDDAISCLLPCILFVYRVNLNKLSGNFVGALRTTTTNCRVSFINLYLVFPRNSRIVFLPHTNTVILLELYCGTITEPG